MSKNKVGKLIFGVVSFIMVFAIFMFFMDVLKWTGYYGPGEGILYSDWATPSFFNLMFGTGSFDNVSASYCVKFPFVGGMLVIFIIQALLSVGAIVVVGGYALKKIKAKNAYLLIAVLGLLAIACGVLSFFSYNFASKVTVDFHGLECAEFLADKTALNYGAYVYGIVMLVVGVASVLPYFLTFCLKDKKKRRR